VERLLKKDSRIERGEEEGSWIDSACNNKCPMMISMTQFETKEPQRVFSLWPEFELFYAFAFSCKGLWRSFELICLSNSNSRVAADL